MAIILTKGQGIDLKKEDGSELKQICIGINWGAIKKKGLFGSSVEAVDLDASVGVFGAGGVLKEKVYFGKLSGLNGAIRHSGDDTTGDTNGDDGLDNEVIFIDLPKIDASVDKLVFVLNSFRGHHFDAIPFASIRIYEGTKNRVDHVLATFNITQEAKYAGHTSMVMGRAYRESGAWKFVTIGEATTDSSLDKTLNSVASKFLG